MKIEKIYIFCFILVFYGIGFSQNESIKLSSTINYVSAENVYLKSGKASGIQVGDKFTVFRNEQIIGHIEVVYVAQNSASCRYPARRWGRPFRWEVTSPASTARGEVLCARLKSRPFYTCGESKPVQPTKKSKV